MIVGKLSPRCPPTLQSPGSSWCLPLLHPPTPQISSRYGTEATKATVDFTLYDPAGRIIHSEVAVSSAEATVTGHGGQGPWRACFKVSRQQILRPSVIVRLSYFTVNSPSLVGTHFEWQRTPPEAGAIQLSPGGVTAGELGELLFVCVCISGGLFDGA